jgi:hypothetical protein
MHSEQLGDAPIEYRDLGAQLRQYGHQAVRDQDARFPHRLVLRGGDRLLDGPDAFGGLVFAPAMVLLKKLAQRARMGRWSCSRVGQRSHRSPTKGLATSSNHCRTCGKYSFRPSARYRDCGAPTNPGGATLGNRVELFPPESLRKVD